MLIGVAAAFTCPDGRVQWDPSRDLFAAEDNVPRKMTKSRAIQIEWPAP